MSTNCKFKAALLLTMAGAVPALAQVQRSGGGEAQKFMQQYQQVSAEKTALQAQLAQTQKDFDSAKTELAAAKKERDAFKVRAAGAAGTAASVAQLTSSRDTAEKSLQVSKQRMTELVARFRETATALAETEADRNKLRKDVEQRDAAFDKCAQSNLDLYEINRDILDRYEHVGVFTKVSAAEPFTRITRVRIENLVDEYRARAEVLRTKKRAP